MKTLVRTNQLGSELLQPFSNKSGLSPTFDFLLNGYSTGGNRILSSVIDKSPFANATAPNFGNDNPNAQSLWRVVNKDDTGNRYIQWFDLDKPSVPGNAFVVGTYIRTLNDVNIPIGIVFEVVPTTNTNIPIGFRYQERGKTTNARPFQAFDNIALTGNYTTPSVSWLGYSANFRSANGIGFQAINRGTGSGTGAGYSYGFSSLVYTDVNDGTVDEEKFGFVSQLVRTPNPTSVAYLIGYRAQVVDTSGTTTQVTRGYEFGVFGTNILNVSGSSGFFVFGNGIVQNFRGFAFDENNFITPSNNKAFVADIVSASDTGSSHFIGNIFNPKARVFNALVVGDLTGDGTVGVRGFRFVDNGYTFNNLGFSAGLESNCFGIWNTDFNGIFTTMTGTIGAGAVFKGWLNSLDNAIVNGSFIGMSVDLSPATVAPGAQIFGRVTNVTNVATTGSSFQVDKVSASGNITSSPVIVSYYNGTLGTATVGNPFNSFTQRYAVSNFNTTLASEEIHNWDIRGIGVSSPSPVNSRLGFFVNDAERFNIQNNGNVEVVNGDLVMTTGKISMNNDIVFSASTQGPVLVSPNGSRFRIIVDNLGNLSTVAVP